MNRIHTYTRERRNGNEIANLKTQNVNVQSLEESLRVRSREFMHQKGRNGNEIANLKTQNVNVQMGDFRH